MSETKSSFPIDNKSLATIAGGFVLGLLILGLFIALAYGLHLPLLIDHQAIPWQ
ncbi:MAG: hypothetical protein U0802_00245 [Candidatus Binatia bacterium]